MACLEHQSGGDKTRLEDLRAWEHCTEGNGEQGRALGGKETGSHLFFHKISLAPWKHTKGLRRPCLTQTSP